MGPCVRVAWLRVRVCVRVACACAWLPQMLLFVTAQKATYKATLALLLFLLLFLSAQKATIP